MSRPIITLALAVAGLASLTACSGVAASQPAQRPDPFTFTGVMNVQMSDRVIGASEQAGFVLHPERMEPYVGDRCAPEPGVDVSGAKITVRDSVGTVVATGAVKADPVVARGEIGSGFGYLYCSFAFSVPGVPDEGQFFSVAVGRHAPVDYTLEEMKSGELELNLG